MLFSRKKKIIENRILDDEMYEPSAKVKDFDNLDLNPAWLDLLDFLDSKITFFRDDLESGEMSHEDLGLNTEDKIRGAIIAYRSIRQAIESFRNEAEGIEEDEKMKGENNGN
jgi:hypothetical protein